jgi:ketosteroid isomerase-like protein
MVHDDVGTALEGDAVVGLVLRFNDALNARDVDAAMQLMAEDCVFENTYPGPDGTRYEGKPAVRASEVSSLHPAIYFEVEVFVVETAAPCAGSITGWTRRARPRAARISSACWGLTRNCHT